MIPMPPSRAIAIAIGASVTVSMLALRTGTASFRSRVSWVDVSTSRRDVIRDRRGTRSTSSYVSPSGKSISLTPAAGPLHRQAAVDHDVLPGHAVILDDHQDGVGDVFDGGRPLERRALLVEADEI